MGHKWIAAACVVAGVAVLVGPGWALLAAGVLFYLTPAPARLTAALQLAGGHLARFWKWLISGRKAVAVATMPPAVVLVPAGAWVMAGAGAALIVMGVLLGGLSLLSGWNT